MERRSNPRGSRLLSAKLSLLGDGLPPECPSQPEYAHLKTKLYLGGDGNYPLEFTTNAARPTKQEMGSLYTYHADAQPCAKNGVEGLAPVHPLMMLTLVEIFQRRTSSRPKP